MIGPILNGKEGDTFHEDILSAINFTKSKAADNAQKRARLLNLPDTAVKELVADK